MSDQVNVWQNLIIDKEKVWVAFENGTCVVLVDPEDDPEKQAADLLAKFGPVRPGSSSGDFSVSDLLNVPGWVVSGNHPDILNYVSPDEVNDLSKSNSFVIGLIGRQHRDGDARNLKIVYVHDPRTT